MEWMDGWGGGEGKGSHEESVTTTTTTWGDSVDARLVANSYIALLPTHPRTQSAGDESLGEESKSWRKRYMDRWDFVP